MKGPKIRIAKFKTCFFVCRAFADSQLLRTNAILLDLQAARSFAVQLVCLIQHFHVLLL
jgi:hypothetical protein